ncbi:hypothetical protein KR067_009191, partial [Drosophila pandora]
SDYQFLVTGGYRPESNNLVKHVVSVRKGKAGNFGDNHLCGGSIISKRAILTAAHCVYELNQKIKAWRLSVVAGTPKRLVMINTTQIVRVKRIRVHPRFKKRTLRNDLAILIMEEELSMGDSTDTISIANKKPVAGLNCTVIGWGTLLELGPLPDEVVNGDMQIQPKSFCEKIEGFRAHGMMCASSPANYEVDSCQGDSGGPLICDERVYGIVSFGFGCGGPNNAGIYTDVYHYHDWIEKNSCPEDVMSLPLVLLLLITYLH